MNALDAFFREADLEERRNRRKTSSSESPKRRSALPKLDDPYNPVDPNDILTGIEAPLPKRPRWEADVDRDLVQWRLGRGPYYAGSVSESSGIAPEPRLDLQSDGLSFDQHGIRDAESNDEGSSPKLNAPLMSSPAKFQPSEQSEPWSNHIHQGDLPTDAPSPILGDLDEVGSAPNVDFDIDDDGDKNGVDPQSEPENSGINVDGADDEVVAGTKELSEGDNEPTEPGNDPPTPPQEPKSPPYSHSNQSKMSRLRHKFRTRGLARVRSRADSDEQDTSMRRKRSSRMDPSRPYIWTVPVDELPPIDLYESSDVPSVESSESEDEPEDSDAGSIQNMIIPDSGDPEEDTIYEGPADPTGSGESESDSVVEPDGLTYDESDDDWRPGDETLADLDTEPLKRNERPQRHRIPTLKYWLNERVVYAPEGSRYLPTAVEVVRVKPRERKPAPRRRRRRIRRSSVGSEAESRIADTTNRGPSEVQANLYGGDHAGLQPDTVAWSIHSLPFERLPSNPLIEVCVLFASPLSSALESLVIKMQPTGRVEYEMVQNRTFTFVVWSGECEVTINSESFPLGRGMACRIPSGNDLSVENKGTTSVYLIVNEFNGVVEPTTQEVEESASSVVPAPNNSGVGTRSLAASEHFSGVFR